MKMSFYFNLCEQYSEKLKRSDYAWIKRTNAVVARQSEDKHEAMKYTASLNAMGRMYATILVIMSKKSRYNKKAF